MKILSNTNWFTNRWIGGQPVESVQVGSRNLLVTAWRSLSADVVVINEEHRQLLVCCLMRWLFRRRRQSIIAFDQILEPEQPGALPWRRVVIRWLLREVRHFVFIYRETEEVARLYGIPKDRISYVPFKVNGLESVLATPTRDDGYLLAPGRSRRDYVTFCNAVRTLPVQSMILAPIGVETREHGTIDELKDIPENVKVVHDDGSWESWLRWLSGAKLVVIPILPPTIAASGIGTYLVAMAMGKCVVITDSPATRGILTDGQAIVVPPCDAEALNSSIDRLLKDPALLERTAQTGKAYALTLGDETRLASDMVALVERVVHENGMKTASSPVTAAGR